MPATVFNRKTYTLIRQRAPLPNNASLSPTSYVIVKYIYSAYLYLFNQTIHIVTNTMLCIDRSQQGAVRLRKAVYNTQPIDILQENSLSGLLHICELISLMDFFLGIKWASPKNGYGREDKALLLIR